MIEPSRTGSCCGWASPAGKRRAPPSAHRACRPSYALTLTHLCLTHILPRPCAEWVRYKSRWQAWSAWVPLARMADAPQAHKSTTSVQDPTGTARQAGVGLEPLKRIDTPRSSGTPTISSQKNPAPEEDTKASAAEAENKEQHDSDIVVGWDGPDDPENPRTCVHTFLFHVCTLTLACRWSPKRKWAVALTVSSFTFISPIASSMVAPAASHVAESFNIHHSFEGNLTISIFVLAYGQSFGVLEGRLC